MTAQPHSVAPRCYLIILSVLWVFSLTMAVLTPASWDVAWRLEIAQRILDNAVLYRDIIELNPPLWFWSALPSTYLSGVFAASPYVMMCVMIHLVALVGLYLLDRSAALLVSQRERRWLVIGALIALLLLPISETGQREPPIFLAALLWGCLAVARARAMACSTWLVVGITAFAAYGFALKHYYLVIPIGIEIWLIATLKRAWRPFRLETLLLVGLGLAYGVSILTLAPNFLPDIVPLIQLSYSDVKSITAANPFLHPIWMVLQSLLIIVPAYFVRNLIRTQLIAQMLILTIILHVLVVFIQGKGFANHFLAAKGAALVLWAYSCGRSGQFGDKFLIDPRVILGVLASIWIFYPATESVMKRFPVAVQSDTPMSTALAVVMAVEAEQKSSRVFVVSTNPGLGFYLQWKDGRRHFSRYYGMWMLPGLLTSQRNAQKSQAATRQLNLVRAATMADIQCAAPHIIIGDTTTHGRAEGSQFQSYDIKALDVLLSDASFAAWLASNYNQERETSGMTILRAKQSGGPTSSKCLAKY